jgi:hypothetical protein
MGKLNIWYQNSSTYNKEYNLSELFSESENKFLSSYGHKIRSKWKIGIVKIL